MRYKLRDLFLAGFFLVFILSFSGWAWIKDDQITSELEGRNLAAEPVKDIDEIVSGEYFKKYDDYFNDQFPNRDMWIERNAFVERFVLNKNVIRDVYIHDDGYLISPVAPANSSQSVKTVNQKINHFAQELNQVNIDTYFALVPNKSTIMEYKLPDYIDSHANELTDQLLAGFSNEVTAMDFREEIKPHLEEENMYFFTDHHWKPKASFYAYEKVIETISMKHSEAGKPLDINDFKWEEHRAPFYGSEARKVTSLNVKKVDTVTIVKPKVETKPLTVCYGGACDKGFYDMKILESPDLYMNRYRAYFSGDVPEGVIKNPNVENGLKVLILKDSYANAMIQFVSQNFEETRFLDLRKHKNLDVKAYAVDHDIDMVLFIHNINSIVTTPQFIQL